jgi:uncharacterized membrane protein YhaH (DUF805 family)
MAVRLDPEPSPRSGWRSFLLTMLANAAGTVLAAMVIYLYGVAVGAIQANRRVIVPIAILLGWLIIVPLEILWIDFASRRLSGRRLPALLDSFVASLPLLLLFPILLVVTDAVWGDENLLWRGLLLAPLMLGVIAAAVLERRQQKSHMGHSKPTSA